MKRSTSRATSIAEGALSRRRRALSDAAATSRATSIAATAAGGATPVQSDTERRLLDVIERQQEHAHALEARLTRLEKGDREIDLTADDEDDPNAGGPYPPYHDDRKAELVNPCLPVRPVDCPLKPHIFPLKDSDNEYFAALRKKKSQAYHEYHTLLCVLHYYWDTNAYLAEVWNELVGDDDRKQEIVQTLGNAHRELYALLTRRKNLLELRTRVATPELESHDHDARLLAEIERKAAGFTRYLGSAATIDQTFAKWAKEFYKKADTASFAAAAKASGARGKKPGSFGGSGKKA